MKNTMEIHNNKVNVVKINSVNYISLTDIARYKNASEPKDVVKNWLRNKNTISFLGLWETINNSAFKGVEFDPFEEEAGYNHFTMSPISRLLNSY